MRASRIICTLLVVLIGFTGLGWRAVALDFVTDFAAVTVPEGGTATFRVKLAAMPTANGVQVSVSRVAGDASISVTGGSTLTFDAANWDTYQVVTLAMAEDADLTSDTATIRIHRTSGDSVADKDVTATEGDNDAIFIVDESTITVPEGGTATFCVKLGGMPSASGVQVSVTRVSGDASISVTGGGTLTFTQANWNTYQTVTLAAAEDADLTSDTATIRIHRTSGDSVADKDVTATEGDNDSNAQLTTDVTAVTVPEGGTATFRVKLTATPTASGVQVSVTRLAGDASISVTGGATLTFTQANWNTYQTVTLAAAEDADLTSDTATIRIHRTSGDSVADKDVTATEGDTSSEDPGSPEGSCPAAPKEIPVVSHLSWEVSDIDSPSVYCTVFLDTVNPPMKTVKTVEIELLGGEGAAAIPVEFDHGTEYYWRVQVSDGICAVLGDVWTVGASSNHKPEVTFGAPVDGAIGVPWASVQLEWDASDLDGDAMTYRVEIYSAERPNYIAYDTVYMFLNMSELLEPGTTYYWAVTVTDEHGAQNSTHEWSQFTTAQYVSQPPDFSDASLSDLANAYVSYWGMPYCGQSTFSEYLKAQVTRSGAEFMFDETMAHVVPQLINKAFPKVVRHLVDTGALSEDFLGLVVPFELMDEIAKTTAEGLLRAWKFGEAIGTILNHAVALRERNAIIEGLAAEIERTILNRTGLHCWGLGLPPDRTFLSLVQRILNANGLSNSVASALAAIDTCPSLSALYDAYSRAPANQEWEAWYGVFVSQEEKDAWQTAASEFEIRVGAAIEECSY